MKNFQQLINDLLINLKSSLRKETKTSVKYITPKVEPLNEVELNKLVIIPAVLLDYRIKIVRQMLAEYTVQYNEIEKEQGKNKVGYSNTSHYIDRLYVIKGNINILEKELQALNDSNFTYSENYKSYLKLSVIPSDKRR